MYLVAHEIVSRTACEEDIVGEVYEWAPHETLDEIEKGFGYGHVVLPNHTPHWALSLFKPNIGAARLPTREEAQKALDELEREFGNKFWSIQAVGLGLNYRPRDRKMILDVLNFPFNSLQEQIEAAGVDFVCSQRRK
jgi:hypothetical protein